MINKKKIDYHNIKLGIEREEQDDQIEKDHDYIDKFLQQKYNLKRPPYIRDGISVTQEDIDLAKEIRGKVAKLNPLNIPNKSQIYRAGLQALNHLSTEEVIEILEKLK